MTPRPKPRGRRSALDLLAGIVALAIAISAGPMAMASEPPGQFVEALGRTAIRDLTQQGLTQDQREKRFRVLLNANFDMQRISRFVLGRYTRDASTDDLRSFAAAYEDFMVLTYARLFASYAGETFRVTHDLSTPGSRYSIVKSEINLPGGGETVALDWQILSESGRHAVVDLRVEGVSMAITQRDEFAALLQRSNGSIPALVEELRRRIVKLRNTPPAG